MSQLNTHIQVGRVGQLKEVGANLVVTVCSNNPYKNGNGEWIDNPSGSNIRSSPGRTRASNGRAKNSNPATWFKSRRGRSRPNGKRLTASAGSATLSRWRTFSISPTSR